MTRNMNERVKAYRRKRRFRSRWAKLLAVMACVVVFCTTYALILPAITLENKDAEPLARTEAEKVCSVSLHEESSDAGTKQVDLREDAHILLQLADSADSCQWQIWSPDREAWLDIYGDNNSSCEVYYAKLSNMLNGGSASIRATAETDSGEWVSDTVTVTVSTLPAETAEEAEPVIRDTGSSPLGDVSGTADEGTEETTAVKSLSAAADTSDSIENMDEEIVPLDETESSDTFTDTPDNIEGQGDDGIAPQDEPGDDSNEDTQTKHTVRVNYVLQTDTGAVSVADPWWATFSASGETGSYQVNFPTVQGYKVKEVQASDNSTPDLVHGTDGTAITGLKLPETVTDDLIYSVVYEADTVQYTVHHWLQNLDDPDQYTMQENDTETKSALTGTLLRDDADSYEGFTQVAYAYPTLAGDGSTVIDIRYDRVYYKIDFELNGGEGVNGIYVQYGTDLSGLTTEEMTTPTRTGHVFTGWYTDAECTQKFEGSFPASMPAQNSAYYAGWAADETYYSVAVWVESLTEGDYEFLCSFDNQALTGAAVAYTDEAVKGTLQSIQTNEKFSGYQPTLKYFMLDHGDEDVTVNGDGSTVLNVYYTRNSYTLRFVYGRSYSSGRRSTYQVSGLNNAYSSHYYTEDMTNGNDLAQGCYWYGNTSGTNAGFSFDSEFKQLMDKNPGRFDTGSFTERCTETSPTSVKGTSYTYYYIDLTAKYDEDIHAYWPQAGSVTLSDGQTSYANLDWGVQYGSQYQKEHAPDKTAGEPNIHPYYANMDSSLIIDAGKTAADDEVTHTLVAYSASSTIHTWTYTYYYEALSGDTNTVDYNGRKYVEGDTVTVRTTQVNHDADHTAVVGMKGFVNPSADADTLEVTSTGPTTAEAKLYYVRERYSITFDNGYGDTKIVGDIPYGESLNGYEGKATCTYSDDESETTEETFRLNEAEPLMNRIDENFEAKYQFGGSWYTGWSETTGTGIGEVFNLNDESLTMPQSNLVIYPEWTPHIYKATFYWQNVQKPVLKDEDGETEVGAVPVGTYPKAVHTYAYGGQLEDFEVEYAQYEFLHWSYLVWVKDYTGTDHNGTTTVHKYEAGSNVYVPDDLDEAGGEAFSDFVNQMIKRGYIEEVRLDFDTAAFTSNTAIFGTWNDVVYLDYTVHYVLLNDSVDADTPVARVEEEKAYDADGKEIGVQIADDDADSRLAGESVTLAAKTDQELYEEYQPTQTQVCYPIGSSTHSLFMDIQADKLEYTFVYKRTNPVTYKVQYLTPELDENGVAKKDEYGNTIYEELSPSVTVNSTQAIVTENSLAFRGYSLAPNPDTGKRDYQITRILSYAEPDGSGGTAITEANTITFYYVKDVSAVSYTVEYYYQQLDGSYAKYDAEMTFDGTVGETYTAQEITIPGWWCDRSVEGTNESQRLPDSGMTLKLYYSAYPLTVTKNWADTVQESEKTSVDVAVYEAVKQTDNSYAAQTVSDSSMKEAVVTLNSNNNWTKTIYLPYLEYLDTDEDSSTDDTVKPYDDRFYALTEISGGFTPAYGGNIGDTLKTIFVDNTSTKAAEVKLGSVTGTDREDTVSVSSVTVTNAPARALPETGGPGTTVYTISGLLFLIAAVMYGYTVRRKRERRTNG